MVQSGRVRDTSCDMPREVEDGMTFQQVWPPRGSMTFVALRTEDDTRDG